MNEIILIVYTTKYRRGGHQFKKVAQTLASEKTKGSLEVRCQAIESKAELKSIFTSLVEDDKSIYEFHFIGHAGMYGPMFGTVSYPEQFSPYELENLKIPFSTRAKAYFRCCRSARWFAPFFSKAQNVQTYGYYWYTTFSARKDRYALPIFLKNRDLYCFGSPGRKSHGWSATLKKMAGLMKPEPLKEFNESNQHIDRTYNNVADLYADTFKDIKVRQDEYTWIKKHIPKEKPKKVLDIGCGNGALLRELRNDIEQGVGIDISENLLKHATKSNAEFDNLEFKKIDGPKLNFPSEEFDLVISLLSFRYLDWDPIMKEIERVLKSEGKLIIVDMVTAPVKWIEIPLFMKSKISHYFDRYKMPEFYRNLRKLVSHPAWSVMLRYNPIRSQHEMKWYLESRFPGRKVEVINVGLHSRIIAFDSLNMKNTKNMELSYP
ncbi:class I SAM-dependent methyltransferase [Reichenbachiella sp.]|uniref:class I SAM-dependent methyltransferase n=1 Tax=Reichenbachiella sp. TaxID=2184521 RepID=UPI003BAEB183